jgi:GT2 family glycosyltransferase
MPHLASPRESAATEISAVVPTLGLSPLLVSCLEALRRDGGPELEIVVVHQGEEELPIPPDLVDRVHREKRNLGFAAGTNRGLQASAGTYVATVNDDVVVEPGWTATLLAALRDDPGAAAAQGINVLVDRPDTMDGCGLAWNRWWQAVQIGHGQPLAELRQATEEVFGVSATAAVFRRQALEEVAGERCGVFDPPLGSYYEDVDLAARLRTAGYRSLAVAAARARHGGSWSGHQMPVARLRWIYRNRLLVLARLLGRAFWLHTPRILGRDVLDLLRALRGGDANRIRGIFGGWCQAALALAHFAHTGRPAVPVATLKRFCVT